MSSHDRAFRYGLGAACACALMFAFGDLDARVTKITITKTTSPMFNGHEYKTTFTIVKPVDMTRASP